MDTSPIPGFITRKQAAENCGRSERTLQRYWSRAIELEDVKILQHLKLRSEDGQVVEGPAVTKDLIEQLKKRGQNPTWFVHAIWVQETYGPQLQNEDEPPSSEQEKLDIPPHPNHASGTPEMDALLQEQLRKREEEIAYLRGELTIKNEQIREANERTRESNILMRDLQKMLGDWHQQAFRTLPSADPSSKQASAKPLPTVESPVDDEPVASKPNQGSSRKVNSSKRTTSKSNTKSKPEKSSSTKRPPKSSKRNVKQPTVFEKHTPTIHKAMKTLFRK